ncbi:hypothetical protein ADU76_12485 [Clostridium botulinum]|nr:hypothetical protein ADU76_12485 [Clostridium botulinum]
MIKIKLVKKIKRNFISDILIFISFFIVFITTYKLNKYVAMYLLALFLFILSYFISKGGK